MSLLRHLLGFVFAVIATAILLPVLSDVTSLFGISSRYDRYHLYLATIIPFIAAFSILPYLVAIALLMRKKWDGQWSFAVAGSAVGLAAYASLMLVFEMSALWQRSIYILVQLSVVGAIVGLLYYVLVRKILRRVP